jgi:phosphonate transport system substrate-binding protein
MNRAKKAAALLCASSMALALAGCSPAAPTGSENALTPGERWGIDKLTVVLLPGEDTPEVADTRNVFDKALSEHLGIPVEEYHGDDYSAVVEAMRTGAAQVASFGPFSYVHAVERSGAECFAVQANNGVSGYYSHIIIYKGSGIESLDDLEGRSFGFVDPESTSGNVVPSDQILLHFASKRPGLTFDDIHVSGKLFSSVAFTGNHTNSVRGVAMRDIDAAGVASTSVTSLVDQGLVSEDDFVILHTSPWLPPSPFAYQKDLKPELKQAIKEFFLAWDNQDFWKGRGQKDGDSYRYIDVEDSSYDYIRELRDKYNLTD